MKTYILNKTIWWY